MSDSAVSVPLQSEQQYPHRGMLIAGLLVAMLFAALDNTIVGTAMPRIIGDLQGLNLMAWLSTAYMLTSTVVVLIAGKLADLIGRRPIYLTGLIVFIIGSALCGMAQSMDQLIWFRAIQGIGGGIVMPMAMIIIGDIFTGEQRAKWQGVFGGIFGLASIIGPQVGGWIVDSLNWRWVFYINLPVGFLAIFLIAMGLRGGRAKESVKIDFGGMATMTIGVTSLLIALTFGGKDYDWNSWQILSLFALSAVSLISFVWIESKVSEPLLPLRFFKNKTFTLLNLIGFTMSVGMFGAIMFMPLFMQGILGVSATASGTTMTPLMLSMIAASVIGGRLVRKIGIRIQMAIGMGIMAIGFWWLSTMDIHTTQWTAMLHMIVIGLGMGFVMPLVTIAMQQSFAKSELGIVTSSTQFFRQIGGTFGMTVLGAVMGSRSSQLLTEKLNPFLAKLPPQLHGMVNKFESLIHTNPQGFYSTLLSPEALSKIPPFIKQSLVPILKTSLVDTLQQVFLYGLGFVLVGFVLTFFIGKIEITSKEKPAPSEVA